MNSEIIIPQEVMSQEVSGETVLLDLQSESYFGLDEVGTRIWQLLQEHGDLQFVFEIMQQEYDVEPDKLKADLDELIEKLRKSGLITLELIEE